MDLIRAGNAGRRGWAWAVLLTIVLALGVLSGCGKQGPDIDLADIDISEIDKIEHTGTTGGKDGGFSYTFSEKEASGFLDLLDQVELGSAVDEKEALTSGAVSYYTLYFTDGEMLTISPGRYFQVGDTYYEFRNYDELWDRFIEYNSIQG
jgi:hypothetical protein